MRPPAPEEPLVYGFLAEFTAPEPLIEAARRTREAGYTRFDAYSPFPIPSLAEAIGARDVSVPVAMLVGGILGAAGGYALQYYAMARDYPVNIGGRPPFAWPPAIPITFEVAVLAAALFGVITMLVGNGLPLPYHPLFAVEEFGRVTSDHFFLVIEARDPQFDPQATPAFLASLGATRVQLVRQER